MNPIGQRLIYLTIVGCDWPNDFRLLSLYQKTGFIKFNFILTLSYTAYLVLVDSVLDLKYIILESPTI